MGPTAGRPKSRKDLFRVARACTPLERASPVPSVSLGQREFHRAAQYDRHAAAPICRRESPGRQRHIGYGHERVGRWRESDTLLSVEPH